MLLVVIGTGYVGLVSGACFAEMGYHVICVDSNQEKIDKLSKGQIPLYEPGLNEMVKRNAKAKRLQFTTDMKVVADASLCFITIQTPHDEKGEPLVHDLMTAVAEIATYMKEYLIIVNKSTAPIGTYKRMMATIDEILLKKRHQHIPYDLVINPEFLKEGHAIQDFMKPDRIIIGSDSDIAIATMRKVYAPFMVSHERFITMDPTSAEMTKFASNAMLAARVSLMNEFATLCEAIGGDINKVRLGVGSDTHIGHHYLYPGMGFGGSNFHKDLVSLLYQAKQQKCKTPLLAAVEAVNEEQKGKLGKKIVDYFALKGGVSGKTVAVFGLAFKPNTDEMREASSLVLIQQLLEAGTKIRAFDPAAMENAKKLFGSDVQIKWCRDELDAASGADACALVTEWKQFRFLDFDALKKKMKGRGFFDGRNQYDPKEMSRRGFDYFCIGNSPALAQDAG